MQINIITIGKFKKNCSYGTLFFDYIKKTKSKINLIEINNKVFGSSDEVKNKEAQLIIDKIPQNSKIILLDEIGENITSREFANNIVKFQNQAIKDLSFIIGGANGVSDDIKKSANKIISFGKMTFPHMMVRAMLSEQLYRSYLIINNHPYHKD